MSQLPAWAGRKPIAPAVYDIADSPHTAPGWRILEDADHFTCIPPVDAAVNPEVIRAIRAFDPSIIVLWRKQRYLPPHSNTPEMFHHLCLARRVKNPRRQMAIFHVEMPRRPTHAVPNELLLIWEAFDKRYFFEGGPGGYMPCDGSLYWFLREQYNEIKSGRQIRTEREIAMRERHEKIRAKRREEHDYIQKHHQKFIAKQLAAPGDSVRAFREWQEKHRLKNYQPKPFVFQGAH